MNELRLRPLTCPQCGAPGAVREGTRITECDRCGVRLCLTETTSPRYEVEGRLSVVRAAAIARGWLEARGSSGALGRPELVLVPYHEMAGRRVGVFERKVPERRRMIQYVRHYSGSRSLEPDERWAYTEKEDTKVMVADVQHLSPAARTPWDLGQFDAGSARRSARLRTFDLADAQRRAVVYAEEQSASTFAETRFADTDGAELVAVSARTLFFPFWSVPVRSDGEDYEIVLDGLTGEVVAWRLPEHFPGAAAPWLVLAVPGAVALGHALHAFIFGAALFDPVIAFVLGAIAIGGALWRTARPDWRLRMWPEPGMRPR